MNITASASNAESVVDAYHRAWTSGEIDVALSLIDQSASFTAPDPEITTKAQWREYLAAFTPVLTAAPEVTRMREGNRVALWYYPQTEATTTVLASELFTVEDGKIVDITLSFDRLGYLPPPDAAS